MSTGHVRALPFLGDGWTIFWFVLFGSARQKSAVIAKGSESDTLSGRLVSGDSSGDESGSELIYKFSCFSSSLFVLFCDVEEVWTGTNEFGEGNKTTSDMFKKAFTLNRKLRSNFS